MELTTEDERRLKTFEVRRGEEWKGQNGDRVRNEDVLRRVDDIKNNQDEEKKSAWTLDNKTLHVDGCLNGRRRGQKQMVYNR